ncbi:hypothetical protein CTheo_3709 [Ceratobasidium theobromae]|uniref:Rhodanese domain-containing protein n=1 Tax=Ceratobasidium theobromae TaxID=1582974 RepID=A0A5N5QME9_9AGAM|nr:hypothetical protein CTheo_3709 [Ceratobasidium theobromae]
MVSCWEPGVEYGPDSVVEYQGLQYRIIQPHRSQGDWAPNVTPALWGREWGVPSTQPPPQHCEGDRPWDQHDHTKVELTEEEKGKNWMDLSPERRKQLEVGGGLAAGAAILAGGFFAWKKHKEHEEEKKAVAWGLQNWITDAQSRTQGFYSRGQTDDVAWVLAKGTAMVPQNAFIAGQESDGTPLFVARTYFEGGIHPGKFSPKFKKGAIIGFGGDELEVENYEILVAKPHAVRWVDASGPVQAQFLGRPVDGGREHDGSPLFIAQAPYKNGTHPGKAGGHLQGADITYGGDEKIVNPYRVLVYAQGY